MNGINQNVYYRIRNIFFPKKRPIYVNFLSLSAFPLFLRFVDKILKIMTQFRRSLSVVKKLYHHNGSQNYSYALRRYTTIFQIWIRNKIIYGFICRNYTLKCKWVPEHRLANKFRWLCLLSNLPPFLLANWATSK